MLEDCIDWYSGLRHSLKSENEASIFELMQAFDFETTVPGTKQHMTLAKFENLMQAKANVLNSMLADVGKKAE